MPKERSRSGSDKFPFFPWYAQDWLTDPDVLMLNPYQITMYIHLLSHSWLSGPVPDDVQQIARLTRLSRKVAERHWPGLRDSCWQEADDVPGHVVNRRLERERYLASARSQKSSDAAVERWRKRREKHAPRDTGNGSTVQYSTIQEKETRLEDSPEGRVFQHFNRARMATVVNARALLPTQGRLGKIRARLKEGLPEDLLMLAADGIFKTEHHINSGFKWATIDVTFRSQENVERFASEAREPQREAAVAYVDVVCSCGAIWQDREVDGVRQTAGDDCKWCRKRDGDDVTLEVVG